MRKNNNGTPAIQSPGSQFDLTGPWGLDRWVTPIALVCLFSLLLTTAGCKTTGNFARKFTSQETAYHEADWIINGEPIPFEEDFWYPADGVEMFLDSEMKLMGEHLGVQFFVDRVDVRPYNRIYTKFDKNKFRFYEKKLLSE